MNTCWYCVFRDYKSVSYFSFWRVWPRGELVSFVDYRLKTMIWRQFTCLNVESLQKKKHFHQFLSPFFFTFFFFPRRFVHILSLAYEYERSYSRSYLLTDRFHSSSKRDFEIRFGQPIFINFSFDFAFNFSFLPYFVFFFRFLFFFEKFPTWNICWGRGEPGLNR